MTTAILSLVISILSLGLCFGVLVREWKASRELDGIIADLKREREQSRPAEAGVSLGDSIVYYDLERNALGVKASLLAEGGIAAGTKEE